ncbi:MAG: hypothetical protein ABSF70_07565 [Terracidiphilus sp.]
MRRVASYSFLAFGLCLSMAILTGCNSFSSGSSASAPKITSFVANPAAVTAGGTATLTAVFTGGTGVITPGNLPAISSAAVNVSPVDTTIYTLTVTNSTGIPASMTATVTVLTAQTITFANPGAQTVGTPLTLSATASSGLTVAFASQTTSVCTVSGKTATFLITGTCTIQATQAGNGIYAAATPVSQSFTVSAALTAQTITFANPGAQTVGTPLTLVATASSGLTVSFTSTTTSVCTVSGTTATFLIANTCSITASQAGNATYAPATPVARSFTVNASSATDPTSSVLPSYDDAYANWKNAGLLSVGGIPNRTTVCATVNPLGGGQDDFTNIQNAIDNCPKGEVVQLGAGAFTVHIADLPIQISTAIVLRGTGNCSGSATPYCQTSIAVSDGALAYTGGVCGTDTSHEVTCPNGGPPLLYVSPVSIFNWSWAQCGNPGFPLGTGCGATPLDADAAQGQTTIQVHNTSNFSVGQWVLIDEASGAGWVPDPLNARTGYGQIWAASDWLNSSGSPATGRVMWSKSQNGGGWDFGSSYPYQASSVGCWHSYCDRPTAELHLIASIGAGPCPGANCSLTFDDPLTVAFRQSAGHNAQVYQAEGNQSGTSPISFLQNAGAENLSLLRAPNGGLGMLFCAYCWAKNVEVGNWYGGGVNISYSARSELNTVYVHHCWDSVNSGTEYPIALDDATTELLVTNSITNFGGKGMVARAGGAGSVVSYSYVDDTMYDAESGIGDYWLDMGLNASHYSTPHHVLFEGNWADNLDNDHTHGNSVYITFFRNQGTGMRTPFIDPSLNKEVNDFEEIGYACGTTGPTGCWQNAPAPFRAAGPMAYNYWFAFVGNVLGLAGETTAANGWTYQGDWNGHRMFMLGWNDSGGGGQDPYLTGVSGSYIFIHGNYDYVNNAVTWDSSTPDHALPNSFYLSSKPAFFNDGSGYAWPWVTPTGSQPVQTGPSGCGGTCSALPAKARYEAGTPFVQP